MALTIEPSPKKARLDMIAQHVLFARTLASSWLLRLALIAALAALLAASYLAPLAAHAVAPGGTFSASL